MEVKEWIINDALSGEDDFCAICNVVNVLSKHGLWQPELYHAVREAYNELEKMNENNE